MRQAGAVDDGDADGRGACRGCDGGDADGRGPRRQLGASASGGGDRPGLGELGRGLWARDACFHVNQRWWLSSSSSSSDDHQSPSTTHSWIRRRLIAAFDHQHVIRTTNKQPSSITQADVITCLADCVAEIGVRTRC